MTFHQTVVLIGNVFSSISKWDVAVWISTLLFLIGMVWAIGMLWKGNRKGRIWTPHVVSVFFVILSALTWFMPVYTAEYRENAMVFRWFKAFVQSLQHTIRLFAGDDNFSEIMETLYPEAEGATAIPVFAVSWFDGLYSFVGEVLFLVAPILTFVFILSFVKNLFDHLKYKFKFWKNVYIFSELNERSLALAKSIDDEYNKKDSKKGKEKGGEGQKKYRVFKKAMIVYADIIDKNEEAHLDLLEAAKEMGAILFRKDLESIDFLNWRIFRHKKRKMNFYLISEDEKEKIRHAASIISRYGHIPEAKLFLFSDSIESKCFLDSYSQEEKKKLALKVARVNDIRALVYHNIHASGIHLFEDAKRLDDGTREITAVVVGLGRYGMEVIKALLWYCQLPGYRVNIIAFDEQKDAASAFQAVCPSIQRDVDVDAAGDMRYTLSIREANVKTEKFFQEIKKLRNVTYMFVCLGSDNQNITTAMNLRNHLTKEGRNPRIETVVYDSSLKRRMESVWEKRNLYIIGDLDTFYSEKTVINSDLIQNGEKYHQRGGETNYNDFYMNDYNYFSSLAGAMHRNLRAKILDYSDAEKKTLVFPFYYGEPQEVFLSQREIDLPVLRKVFPFMSDPEEKKNNKDRQESKHRRRFLRKETNEDKPKPYTLADEMHAFDTFLYSKLAHLHYGRLTSAEREDLKEEMRQALEKEKQKQKKITLSLWENPSEYLACYNGYFSEIEPSDEQRKTMRALFDCIVKVKTKRVTKAEARRDCILSLEYFALPKEEQPIVAEYVKARVRSSDGEDCSIDMYMRMARSFAYVEHIRWNAYMRSEGFQYSAREDQKEYNLHHNLIPVDQLSVAECIKDV